MGDSNLVDGAEFLINQAQHVATSKYGLLAPQASPLYLGRVNATFKISDGPHLYVLQRLNDLFNNDMALGDNWAAVHQTLCQRSGLSDLPLPGIYPDEQGDFVSLDDHGASWRLTSWLEGGPAPQNALGAFNAGRLLGALHYHLNTPIPLALKPLPDGEFTNQHLAKIDDFNILFKIYCGHPKLTELSPLLDKAMEQVALLPNYPGFQMAFQEHNIVIHGDPKVDNFLFGAHGGARAMLDWDTVGYGNLLVDLAEVARSWGASGRGQPPDFKIDRMAAALEGYAETGLELDSNDLQLLPPVLRAIVLNLARRYLTDALAESYFHWDQINYPSLFVQNKSRSEELLNLAEILYNREMEIILTTSEAYSLGLNYRFGSEEGPSLASFL